MLQQIREQAAQALRELIEQARPQPGALLVVGCSSSEIVGKVIGKGSSMEAAEAVWEGFEPLLSQHQLRIAVQCCEHLNRALIMERDAALQRGLEPVNVRPVPDAGGAFATTAYARMEDPVAVEHIRAELGMDIGGTLIGMHLKEVAVPVRLSLHRIGEAMLLCARTRPKYIGGPRAAYREQ